MNSIKNIGFIDYFLDEWHANNYPNWIHGHGNSNHKVAYAWALRDSEDGMTSAQWCDKFGVELLGSAQDVIDRSDYVIVLSPNNPEQHEALSEAALRSGKPLYIDKTFAPSLEAAKRMVSIAQKNSTPLLSTSALRCAKEIREIASKYSPENLSLVSTTGPGEFSNYAIHQFEMIVALLGTGAKRLIHTGTQESPVISIEYGDDRRAVMTQSDAMPFSVMAQPRDGQPLYSQISGDFFIAFIGDMLSFFGGESEPVAPIEETLQIAAMLDAASVALRHVGEWVDIEGCTCQGF